MKIRRISMIVVSMLAIAGVILPGLAGCAPSTLAGTQSAPAQPTEVTSAATTPETPASPGGVEVVVAGYINHGPMQPTVQAIKDVLAGYGDKVTVTWVDLGTQDGAAYFKQNNLSAHMNVIINGKYQYEVNGKSVTFQWFEGQQWTREDLDAVIADLVGQ